MRAGVAKPTMQLIERFAAFRRRTTLEVLRAYKSQGQAVRASMREDMARMLAEHAAREQAEIAEREAKERLGAPGAGRLERIMGEERSGRIVDVHLDGRAVVRCDDNGELVTGRVVTDPGMQLIAHVPDDDDDPWADDVNHS